MRLPDGKLCPTIICVQLRPVHRTVQRDVPSGLKAIVLLPPPIPVPGGIEGDGTGPITALACVASSNSSSAETPVEAATTAWFPDGAIAMTVGKNGSAIEDLAKDFVFTTSRANVAVPRGSGAVRETGDEGRAYNLKIRLVRPG